MAKDKEIPLYTKVGSKVTVIVAVVLTLLLLKNCFSSVYYGLTTDRADIDRYYEQGFSDGAGDANGLPHGEEPVVDNTLLRKSYQKGYRSGWDSVRSASGP